MAGFLDLPDDILRDIVEEVGKYEGNFRKVRNENALNCLMQTNRRLHNLALPVLYRDIHVGIVCREKDKAEYSKSRTPIR